MMGERWEIGPYKLRRCPIKEMTQEGLDYLQAYKFYKQGQLPCAGGWMDHTNTLIQAFNVIEGEIAKIEKEIAKKRDV